MAFDSVEDDAPASVAELNAQIAEAEARLSALHRDREDLLARLQELRGMRAAANTEPEGVSLTGATVTKHSSTDEKLALFRRLFRGREDVYPRRWESLKSRRSGYQPACANEWVAGLCDKRKTRCAECPHRQFIPVTDDTIRHHLMGFDPSEPLVRGGPRDFTIGVYPLLPDESCWFLAADFDKATWDQDALAFVGTCRTEGVPAALERSRSGKGAHVWIFFAEPTAAALARRLGSLLLTRTMVRRPEIGLDSYDRLFPSQDTMPQGGFGNLIALPLQRKPRQHGNSLFVDESLTPYADQLAFLSSLRPMSLEVVTALVEQAQLRGEILSVRLPVTDDDRDEPWTAPPSRRKATPPLTGPFPERADVVLGSQVYVPRDALPPSLVNRLIRIAAFQNPEFYRAQAMRLPTFDKPRIISCAEDYPRHIALPRGCLDEALELLRSVGIGVDLSDERECALPVELQFQGDLRPDQEEAFGALLAHETGVLAAATAFGKTVVAARLIAERGVSTLVLVHRQQLLDQWVERLVQFLDIERSSIGQVGAGKRKPLGIIDVALLQSICRKGVVDDLVAQYGHVIFDECHHLPAVSFELVARACKARYITGLSATAVRRDGHHPIIFMQCGPIRYRVNARAQAAQRPFDHHVIVRETGFRWEDPEAVEAPPTIHQLYTALAGDDVRNGSSSATCSRPWQTGALPLSSRSAENTWKCWKRASVPSCAT